VWCTVMQSPTTSHIVCSLIARGRGIRTPLALGPNPGSRQCRLLDLAGFVRYGKASAKPRLALRGGAIQDAGDGIGKVRVPAWLLHEGIHPYGARLTIASINHGQPVDLMSPNKPEWRDLGIGFGRHGTIPP